MFEEGLVITLLLAIFFVVFYIIYNNSCGCNKSLIENFENDSTNAIFSNAIEQINEINGRINNLEANNESNIDAKTLDNIQKVINEFDEINGRINNLEANNESNIDAQTLDNIQKVINEFDEFKERHPYLFIKKFPR